jgi:hypothetical protein
VPARELLDREGLFVHEVRQILGEPGREAVGVDILSWPDRARRVIEPAPSAPSDIGAQRGFSIP